MKRLLSTIITGFGIALISISNASLAASNESLPVQVAAVPTNGQLIQVRTMCYEGAAIFKITNVGDSLPFAYSFKIVRLNSNSVVSARRLKLIEGQNATFKVKNADKIPSDIGLRIDAKDYGRDGDIHALVRCDV
jgi:hypothetical protein